MLTNSSISYLRRVSNLQLVDGGRVGVVRERVGQRVGQRHGERRRGAVGRLVQRVLLAGLPQVQLVPVASHRVQYFWIHAAACGCQQ